MTHTRVHPAPMCSGAQRNSVYLAEAASLFEEGEYVQAAALYGKVGLLSGMPAACGSLNEGSC